MTPQELWDLPTDEFNLWREKNDLPKLFMSFEKNLPGFGDWLSENNFLIDTLVKIRNPGELFHGEYDKYLIDFSENHPDDRYYFVHPQSTQAAKEVERRAKEKNHIYQRFTPYILWGQRKYKTRHFLPGKNTKLLYGSGHAPDVPDLCQWKMMGHYVLKLGGLTITRGYRINRRNLDFTNLDFLTIEGPDHGNIMHSIYFAHAHNIRLNDGKLSSLNLVECDFQNLKLENSSEIYATHFHNGNLWSMTCKNSELRYVTFDEISMNRIDLQNSYIEEVKYIPMKRDFYSTKASTYRYIADNFVKFRIAYSRQGDRKRTKESHYFERKFELFSTIASINTFWGHYKLGKNRRQNRGTLLRLKREFFRCIQQIRLSFLGICNYLLWGFGEKPHRLIYNSILVIIAYSFVYYLVGISESWIDGLYNAIFGFVRIGGVNLAEYSNQIKLLVGSETFFGWIMIALIINGYANKTKY